jgi:hypothetical protein
MVWRRAMCRAEVISTSESNSCALLLAVSAFPLSSWCALAYIEHLSVRLREYAQPTCPNCAGMVIEYDTSAGNGFCVSCGTVVEENTIVNEVTFGETSTGAAMVQGSYVGIGASESRRAGWAAGRSLIAGPRSSRAHGRHVRQPRRRREP